MHLSIIITGLAALASVAAHPGHDVRAEAAERAAFLERTPLQSRSLSHCASSLKHRGLEKANVVRRHQAVNRLRQDRGLVTGMFVDCVSKIRS